MYFVSSIDINTYDFKFKDLYSRLREFFYLEIKEPDDEMCKMLMVKLFSDKQIIIKNKEIFDFIFKRLSRTYLDIYIFVEKLDRLSLEKKRQLTIPLIKEII
jgi:chromosomal replication initiation ATPase DnaA